MLPVMQMGTRRPRGCQLGLTPFPSILPLLVGCSGLTSCQGAGLAQETTGSAATGCAAPRYSAGRPLVCALLCLVPPLPNKQHTPVYCFHVGPCFADFTP